MPGASGPRGEGATAALGPLVPLGIAAAALGVALLVPRLYADPVGVDPYATRLAAVAVGLLVAAVVLGQADALAVLLAVATVAAPFSLWAATPHLAAVVTGDRVVGNGGVLAADVAYVVLTLGGVVLARFWVPAPLRPRVRLARLPPRAALAGIGASALLVAVALALPAPLLGREAIQPVAAARDLPLLGPAFALQAMAQEVQFRGLLLGALERGCAPWVANLGQAAFFGLAHVAVQYEGPAGPFVPVTVALGWGLGWLTQRTASVWPAIVVHAVLEVAVAVAVVPGLYGQ